MHSNNSSTWRRVLGLVLAALVVAACFSTPLKSILCLPDSHRMVVGEKASLPLTLPEKLLDKLDIDVLGSSRSVFSAPQEQPVAVNRDGSSYDILALKPGRADVQLKLLGYIPLKSIQVESLPPRRVVVGGHSIGVLLKSQGIMVVGHAPLVRQDGAKDYPAKEQGIELGDLILRVNGCGVQTENELAMAIDEAGRAGGEVEVALKRGKKETTVSIRPLFCPETQRYRIGLYVRDGVAGVGTLSFWDPQTSKYAALGHVIVDADTRKKIDVRQGQIVSASIQTIRPGRPGRPGEKIGLFDGGGKVVGEINKNTFYGIYGTTRQKLENPLYPYPLEVGYAHQVKEGSAEILTVLNDQQIEKFQVNIDKVHPERSNGKGMVIRIVDPRLLSVTGGIVQGMSGSPIIQDNKIVGAITHVFLNDPERGYGIFMDNMLQEIEGLKELESHKKFSTNYLSHPRAYTPFIAS